MATVIVTFFFGFVAMKKVTIVATIAFFFVLEKKKMTTNWAIIFFSGFVATKKVMAKSIVAFFFVFEKKKKTIMNCHVLLWFYCNEESNGTKLSLPSSVVVL
jgi:hypothetical protein